MCTGVVKELAKMKFSGSPNFQGAETTKKVNKNSKRNTPAKSFHLKYGWKGILSQFEEIPKGLLEPVWCKNKRWIITKAKTKNGAGRWLLSRLKKIFALKEGHNLKKRQPLQLKE